MKVTALDLLPGDKILDEGTFPASLYAGTVATATAVGGDVEIVLADGGRYTRTADHPFTIERKGPA